MVKYYTTTEGNNFLKIDNEILDVTMLYVKNDTKIKSNITTNESYQNLLSETSKNESPWIDIDESVFNDKLSQFN